MPSIADLRAANPWADDISDIELLNLRAEQVGVSIQDAAHAFGYELPRSNTSANLKSGGHGYLAGLGSLGAAVGISGAQQFADSHRAQSELYDSLSTAPKTFDEVHGAGDFLSYAGRLGAQSLPYAAEFAATAGLGGLAMRGTRAAITAAEAAGNVGAATAARAALSRGATAAGVAGSYPSAVGDVLSNQYEQSGTYDLGYAAAAGVPYAALNAVGIEGLATRGLTRGLGKGLTNSRLANAGVMGGVVGASEGLSETGQEVFNQYGRSVVDPNYDPMGEEAQRAYKESFIGGAVLGGIPGGAGGLMQRKLTSGSNLLTGESPEQNTIVVNPGAEVATQQWIDQLTGVARQKPTNNAASFNAAMAAPTGQMGFDPVTGQERPLTGGDTLPQQVQQQPQQQAAEVDPSITPEYIVGKYGIETVKDNGDGTGHWKYFGKDYFKQDAVAELVGKLAAKENAKPVEFRELEDALQQGGKKLAPKPLENLANAYIGTSLQNTAENLNARIKSLTEQGKGADHPELSRLASAYEALVGKEAPAYSATQKSVSQNVQTTPVVKSKQQGTNATQPQQVAAKAVQAAATQVTPATENVNGLIQTGNEQKSFVAMLASNGVELAPKQQEVVQYIENALTNNEQDKVIDAEGTFKIAEIAKTLGIKNRGSVKMALDAVRNNIVKASGRSIEEIKAGLQARAVQNRTVEAADETKLGMSPKQQNAKLEDDAVFGENASMQDINSIGGSVSDVGGKNEALPESAKVETALDQAIAAKNAELAQLEADKAFADLLADPEATIIAADFEAFFDLPMTALTPNEAAEFINRYNEVRAEAEDFNEVEQVLVQEFQEYVDAARTNGSQRLQDAQGTGGQPRLEGNDGQVASLPASTGEGRLSESPVSPENKPAVSTATKTKRRVAKTPEVIWNELAAQYNLPQLNELDPQAQADWLMAKKHDLATANRVFEANKAYTQSNEKDSVRNQSAGGVSEGSTNAGATGRQRPGVAGALPQDSSGVSRRSENTGSAENPTTVERISKQLRNLFFSQSRFDSKITVVNTVEDLPEGVRQSANPDGFTQAFVMPNGKAYMIASRIEQGQELGVFLHEVGVHLGMPGLIGNENFTKLAKQIGTWSQGNGNSIENRVARLAYARVESAEKSAQNDGREFTDGDVIHELVAYFVEEAVNAGVNPSAVSKAGGPIYNWFRTMWAGVKAALRKFGLDRVDNLTAQNIVDLSYGAAALELDGTWHGTAADFRNFDHDYMGTGEGAQAFGWGTYLAQRVGIAKDYWKQDVRRKSKGDLTNFTYKGINLLNDQGVIGSLLSPIADAVRSGKLPKDTRVDVVQRALRFLINNDFDVDAAKKLLSSQSSKVLDDVEFNLVEQKPEGSLMRTSVAATEDEMLNWDKTFSEQSDFVRNAMNDVKIGNRPLSEYPNMEAAFIYQALADKMGPKEASMYLDSLGVKGIQFLDQPSRNKVAMKRTPADLENTIRGAKMLVKVMEEQLGAAKSEREKASAQQALDDQRAVLERAEQELEKNKAFVPTRNLVIFNDKNIVRAVTYQGADRNKVRFSRNAAATFKSVGGETGARVVDDTSHILKKGVGSLTFLHDLVARFKDKLPAVQTWYDSMQKHQVARVRREREAEAIASMADKLSDTSYAKVNAFIGDSTFKQAWGYQPKWRDTVTLNPEMRARWKALTATEQEVADAIFKHGYETQKAKFALLKKIGVPDLMMRPGKLDGPYAPLMRFGNFTAILKSQTLLDAEKAEDTKLVDELKADPKHYQVSMFDTMGQARGFVRKFGDSYAFTDSFENTERIDDQKTMDYKVLQKVMAYVKADKGMPSVARKAMEGFVTDLYLNASAEHSARQQARKRNYRAGYDTDMVRAFLTSARANAAFMANLEYGEQINEALLKMNTQVKNESGERVGQDAYNLFAQHYADNFQYKPTPFQDLAVGLTSAWQLSTSIGYHLTNATQGAMVTVPKLASDFNDYGGAWRHLMDGYKLFKQIAKGTTVDLSKIQNKNLRDALQYAADLGDLDVGMEENLGHFDRMRTGYKALDTLSNIGSTALHKLRSVSRMVETMNRVSAGAAAYNMAIEHGKSVQQAKDYVISTLKTTQGDFTRAGAPLALKKLPKVMTQYRKFQLMMAALYVKAFTQAFRGATAEERAIGKRMLMFKLFHTSMAAGVLGWPMMNLAVMAYAALGGDDEPWDLETDLRAAIGDKMVADLLLHGPGAMLGLDTSAKLGDNNIFSIMPYNDFDFSSGKKAMQTVGALVAGPAGSQAGRFIDGFNYIGQGDYYKGIEKLMPKGAATAMESFRLANEGYTLRNGDVLVKPEDISEFGLLLNALGLPSTMILDMKRENARHYEVNQFFEDRSGEIKQDFLKAYKDKDTAEMAELRKDWLDLQAAKDRQRKLLGGNREFLKRQELSTLLMYPQRHAKAAKSKELNVKD